MYIGTHLIDPPLILAPMAGVTDLPFRSLCRSLGAGLAVSEMIGSQPQMSNTRKTQLRSDHQGEPGPISVQIAGADPSFMARTARINADLGADIIDINMGCPAKKVCKVAAGSALLQDERLVKEILEAVVAAVDIPVTLKIRTGWDHDHKNALNIAYIAQNAGISALSIHGRTRSDKFNGAAEYDTIRLIKSQLKIPIIANGDITDFKSAKFVKDYTGADALMIGRAAMGNPWIFNEILQNKSICATLSAQNIAKILIPHMESLYSFYGDFAGVMIARKHLLWYLDTKMPKNISINIHSDIHSNIPKEISHESRAQTWRTDLLKCQDSKTQLTQLKIILSILEIYQSSLL
ncbi:tRNA-dihydrouridine synthase B [Gammaproteobacteria bacterium]|nr:tRNA-dihydrouridine synthase B [Gammaproteobacteria bacterium]